VDEIRAAQPADLESLFSIRARTRENAISKEQLESIGITVESLAAAMSSGRVMGNVCLYGSNLVGFCLGDVEKGEVLVLAVLPEYERRGIGARLLSGVVERLRAAGCETLWLAASADPRVRAHGFYRFLGWRPNGQKNGSDEILVLERS
jgi:ribosomal protein S18 acetylase RimI-like enzyme